MPICKNESSIWAIQKGWWANKISLLISYLGCMWESRLVDRISSYLTQVTWTELPHLHTTVLWVQVYDDSITKLIDRISIPLQQHCIPPQGPPLSNGFAMDRQMTVTHLSLAGKKWGMDSDDSPRIGNCYSMETSPNQSTSITDLKLFSIHVLDKLVKRQKIKALLQESR